MDPLDPSAAPSPLRPIATFAVAALHALAREEAQGRRAARLLDVSRAAWTRFQGRLTIADFVDLLIEDAAVTQPQPFAQPPPGTLADLPDALVDRWLRALPSLDLRAAPADYLQTQARRLGLPTRLARSALPRLQPSQRLLELPGTGGQLAFHVVHHSDLRFADTVSIACATWQELLLAGLCAVECGARGDLPLFLDPDLRRARGTAAAEDSALLPIATYDGRRVDVVAGLAEDSGGAFSETHLGSLLPGATLALV